LVLITVIVTSPASVPRPPWDHGAP
jgi:hypothetical protein